MQQKNLLLFFVLSFLLLIGYMEIKRRDSPPPKVDQTKRPEEARKKLTPAQRRGMVLGLVATGLREGPGLPRRKVQPVTEPSVTPGTALIKIGDDDPKSDFHLWVKLDPRGASVRSVLLNKFQAEDDDGRPAWQGDAKDRVPRLLELVPDEANEINPSYLLYLFNPYKPTEDRPVDTLGVRPGGNDEDRQWKVVENKKDEDLHTVSFRTRVAEQGLIITKTYTLAPRTYHLGLKVRLERMPVAEGKTRDDRKVRYQLTGTHGLPVEGKWYTAFFRHALIGEEEKGSIYRDYQDLRQINLWQGGNVVECGDKRLIRYAGVAVQYFASVIVVDDKILPGDTVTQKPQNFLARARPTLETAVTREGVVKSVDLDEGSFVLQMPDGTEETFYVPMPTRGGEAGDEKAREEILEQRKALLPPVGKKGAVAYYTDSEFRHIVVPVAQKDGAPLQYLWVDDITVRVATEPIDLRAGESVEHSYLLYNGPVKPSLLRNQQGQAAVSEELVNRYVEDLHLNTLTDYHSPGWMGTFASSIGWSTLLIKCTNLMHWVLHGIYSLVRNYGLSIILLTVLVRGLMFPLSRKQALTSIKMQGLAPEMKKLTEKYKEDRQALGLAQMELYRKHGVNPFGTCWLLLLQMPIFMGLYYALQESIDFRLAAFWPTWIINLSAPDMLLRWGDRIPLISRPSDYGSLLYLGPYLNLLPIIAVVLMLFQQKMMAPPPTDDQQAMQMKVMKFMMIFMGLMFYKVAAGLCIYFIASSLWGFAERKLLPRFSHEAAVAEAAATGAPVPVPAPRPASTAVTDGKTPSRKQGRNKKKDRGGRDEPRGPRGKGEGGWRQRLRDWWAEVLKQAEKK